MAPAAVADTGGSVLVQPDYYSDVASIFAKKFPGEHLIPQPLDDAVSSKSWTNYLQSLDYEHLYFLNSDVQSLSRDKTLLDNRLFEGNLSFAYNVYEIFLQRVGERVAYIEELLEDGFNLNKKETYHWKRKDADWPADLGAQNEIWRQKIKNEYLQRVVAQELGKEEKAAAGADTEEENVEKPETTNAVVSTEEYITKRYKQFLMTLQDNDAEWVLQKYLSSFAHAYDPHSAYMSASSTEDFDIEMKLSLVGIGALLRAEDGAAKIVRLIPGGPADEDKSEGKLRPGDKIIAVGQGDDPLVDILHWPLYKVVRLIRGKKNSKVVLSVIPASDPTGTSIKSVVLIRDEVKLEEQAAKSEIHEVEAGDGTKHKLGVIDLPAFYANMKAKIFDAGDYRRCSEDVRLLLEGLKKDGVDGIILDLRSNGGGSLLEAIRLTGLFIGSGPVVQVKEQAGLRLLPDRNPHVTYDGPLIILVNRLSASASEIVAAALQDYGRAIVVGDSRTHGKGTVQTILPLGRDRRLGSIKITCSLFYRVNGKSTQKEGVTPDVIIPSALDYLDIGEDVLPNAVEGSLVQSAFYRKEGHVGKWGDKLAAKSKTRQEKNQRFAAYSQLVSRIREINETEAVSLNLSERKEQARAERELKDLEKEVGEEGMGEDDEDDRPDMVLEESLSILSDLVSLNASQAARTVSTDTTDTPSIADQIAEWLRNKK